jgi:hypothetical protein
MRSKEWRPLIRAAEAQGWEVRLRSNGHLLWVSPNGDKVFSAQTASDPRAQLNHLRQLRRFGFDATAIARGKRG